MKKNSKIFFLLLLIITNLNLISCYQKTPNYKEYNNTDVEKSTVNNGEINFVTNNMKEDNVMDFNLTDYAWEMQNFPYEFNCGPVENADGVIVKAMGLWKEKYGEDIDGLYDIINRHPFRISYDKTNDCWHINGALDDDMMGAVPQALIKADGTVLSVWIG